jgi:large subunit ribosomal protein L29|tara:strand:+ start:70 stop:246 length:177 start_codon:yes stop_codon:yes gene_type:complete
MKEQDLTNRLNELQSELSKLRTSAARGTIAKDSGKIRTVKRNIARVNTMINNFESDEQ